MLSIDIGDHEILWGKVPISPNERHFKASSIFTGKRRLYANSLSGPLEISGINRPPKFNKDS